jgi:fatty acid desaturase
MHVVVNSCPSTNHQTLISQTEYAKKLRPLMPPEAFLPDQGKVGILLINVAILVLGWSIASYLDRWAWYMLWLYLPFALLMGNSVTVLIFSTHEVLHSGTVKNSFLRSLLSLLGWTMSWIPPTFWKVVHQREHHNKTNSLQDPDRNYLQSQPQSWGKWIHNLFAPSAEVHPLCLTIGMTSAWGIHTFRNLISVLLFNDGLGTLAPVTLRVSAKERRSIAIELLAIATIHLGICWFIGFHPVKLLLGYFLPIWIGYSIAMFYIYTNHLVCQMTDVNDPLINSVSLRVPKIFDLLHLNFSYHTEHHIFPGMNSNYAPMLRELLQTHYPDRFNLLDAKAAWRLLLHTPRHYQDDYTLTDWHGKTAVPCPLLLGPASLAENQTP